MNDQHNGHFLHNLILFGRLLRGLGLDVNPGRMIDLVEAFAHVDIGNRPDFYHTARSLLVHHRDDLPLFDQAFDLFWRKRKEDGVTFELMESPFAQPPKPEKAPLVTPPLNPPDPEVPQPKEKDKDDELVQEVIEVTHTYSQRERLQQKDFGEMTPEELAAVRHFMQAMVWQLGQRRTRRQKVARKQAAHHRIDLRRSLRRNLKYGGELLEWSHRQPKFKPRPLIIIADISGSMERYTRLLLQFIYSLNEGLTQQVEAFVFSTRLTRITRHMHNKQMELALHNVSAQVTDWAGGTRIGDALKSFNFDWGRRVLGHGAVVLLISDGWDRGDPDLLHKEMGRLQRSCHRLIWLNPLLSSPRYEPLTRGMQAALPHIDDFLPVHNLASLTQLADHLAQLSEAKRPFRPQPLTLTGAAFSKPL